MNNARELKLILLAFTASNLGVTLGSFALPLVYIQQTGSLTGAAVIAVSAVVAAVVGQLIGGVIADAGSKRFFLSVLCLIARVRLGWAGVCCLYGQLCATTVGRTDCGC